MVLYQQNGLGERQCSAGRVWCPKPFLLQKALRCESLMKPGGPFQSRSLQSLHSLVHINVLVVTVIAACQSPLVIFHQITGGLCQLFGAICVLVACSCYEPGQLTHD